MTLSIHVGTHLVYAVGTAKRRDYAKKIYERQALIWRPKHIRIYVYTLQ